MVAGLLLVDAVVLFGGDRTVATLELETIGTVVAFGIGVLYFAVESLAGYRESRSG